MPMSMPMVRVIPWPIQAAVAMSIVAPPAHALQPSISQVPGDSVVRATPPTSPTSGKDLVFREEDLAEGNQWWVNVSAPRVLLVVGVEGSGHEILKELWHEVFSTTKVLEMPPEWGCGKEWTEDGVPAMTKSFRGVGPRELWSMPQGLSFPQCGGRNHSLRAESAHPRVDLIARAARGAGVELHVILLHRQLKECLSVDCISRGLEECTPQAETLNRNAKTMASQIHRNVDLSHVSCLQYGHASDMEKHIRKTFGFTTAADVLVQRLLDESVPAPVRKQVPGWANISQSMSEGNVEVAKVCQEANQVDLKEVKAMLTYELDPWKNMSKFQGAIDEADLENTTSVIVPQNTTLEDTGRDAHRSSGFNCCHTCPHCICCDKEEQALSA